MKFVYQLPICTISLVLCHSLTHYGLALADSRTQIPQEFLRPTTKAKIEQSSSSFNASFEFEHHSFISANKSYFGSEENATMLSTLGVALRSESKTMILDGRGFHVPQEETYYVNIRQLNHSFSFGPTELSVGRKLKSWSEADTFWSMGFWQPRFLWNRFYPEEQGLTGLFWEIPVSKTGRLGFFASPVYFPDQTVEYVEKNGKIISKNPWFRTPPPVVDLWEKETSVVASVREPEVIDVVQRASVALSYENLWGKNIGTKLSYAYKPMGQAQLAYEYYLRSLDDGHEAVVTVVPDFPYHHVATLESPIFIGEWRITPSLTYEDPYLRQPRPEMISQNFSTSKMYSLTLSRPLEPDLPQNGQVYFGFMRLDSELMPDQGENVQEGLSQFELRLPYYEAYRVGFDRRWKTKRDRQWSSRLEMTYDAAQEAALFLSRVDYSWNRAWRASVSLNFIGATSGKENEYERAFLRSYKANDSMGASLSYVY